MSEFTKPLAESGSTQEISKYRKLAAEWQLTGLANDTRWNRLLTHFRLQDGWKPRFRFKCLDGPMMDWDREWWHHVPMPFISALWFDLETVEEIHRGRLIPPEVIDHSEGVIGVLEDIGFDFEGGDGCVRIFGYSPRDREGFATTGIDQG